MVSVCYCEGFISQEYVYVVVCFVRWGKSVLVQLGVFTACWGVAMC